MTGHSKYSPSACERWWNCPGSIKLSEGVPPEPTSKYAAEGTVAHALAEEALRKHRYVDAAMEGELIEEGEHFIKVTGDMIRYVDEYLNVIYEDMAKFECGPDRLLVEEKISFSPDTPMVYGTADAILDMHDKAIIYDLKYGVVPVEAKNNKQLLVYGAGYCHTKDRIRNVELNIVQPRVKNDGIVKRAHYTKDQLNTFTAGIITVISKTYGKSPQLEAGKWCKYCPAKPQCPKIKEHVQEQTQIDFKDYNNPHLPMEVNNFTTLELANILEQADLIKTWLDSIEKYANKLAMAGATIPGYKLKESNGRRAWKEGVEDTLGFIFGEDIFTRKIKSPAQLEKMLNKNQRHVLEDFYEKTGKTMKLVKDNNLLIEGE